MINIVKKYRNSGNLCNWDIKLKNFLTETVAVNRFFHILFLGKILELNLCSDLSD